jgi:small GTP-binding protein
VRFFGTVFSITRTSRNTENKKKYYQDLQIFHLLAAAAAAGHMSGRYHTKTNATTATATFHDSRKAATSTANLQQNSTSSTGKKLKIIILGGINAGKTCLLRRYCFNTFDSERRATIGADYFTKQIVNPLLSSDNGIENSDTIDRLVHIQLWDTAGLEGFKDNTDIRRRGSTLGKSFFRNINGALLVYDATSYHSFRALVQWYQILLENSDIVGSDVKAAPVVVVANKIDKLKYELEKPFLKMVPQRNVLGIRVHKFRKRDIPSRRKLNGTSTIGKLEQKMLQDVAEPTVVVSSSANHNTEKLGIDKDPMSRLQHTCTIANPFQDTKYSDLPPLKLGEGKSYSLSLNKDFYGSFLSRASSEQRNKNHFNSLISFESIWKESSSIDDTLPDSDKVLQWCTSNNITIFEASALDGKFSFCFFQHKLHCRCFLIIISSH